MYWHLPVQPKALTPPVGCTLRSFTHHLALLPSAGEVKTHWLYSSFPLKGSESEENGVPDPINLLLVPFPYSISDHCFVPAEVCVGHKESAWKDGVGHQHQFFDLDQCWLPPASGEGEFYDFLYNLIRAAENQVKKVNGVILPEFALRYDMAQAAAQSLADRTKLEFFVSGVSCQGEHKKEKINGVYSAIFNGGRVVGKWVQKKHHRWRLDEGQIRRYSLEGKLNAGPGTYWWEKMTIHPRACFFSRFSPGACMAALVCEDLGRLEPVQSVLRSIGPNLVICLLLDGPQLIGRWSGRYATVLADDPGSSVLTLTCLGLVKRSVNRVGV